MFSFVPRCQGERGAQKYTSAPIAAVIWAWWANPCPGPGKERRRCGGSCSIAALTASRVALAVWESGRGAPAGCAGGVLDQRSDRGTVQFSR